MAEPAADVAYVLPIRQASASEALIEDIRLYLEAIRPVCREILVVDGSARDVFAAHHQAWAPLCIHVRPDPRYRFLNGKVNGLLTGVDLASADKVICGDDDVRYRPREIGRMSGLLDHHEYVKPQNYFDPLPLHARVESARMLVNRATLETGDYPGTCGFRKSVLLRLGPYDGDVLFENEEMFRHFARGGADVYPADDFFVRKLPPSLTKFLEQRPRQSYEDLAMRRKTGLFAAFLPVATALRLVGSWRATLVYLGLWAAAAMALAWRGRARAGAASYFPPDVPLFSFAWVLERGVSVYVALFWRVCLGGLPYWGRIVPRGTGEHFAAGGRAARQRARAHRTGPSAPPRSPRGAQPAAGVSSPGVRATL